MLSDFGICCMHLSNRIFSHDTIPLKYRCTNSNITVLIRLRKHVFVRTTFCAIRMNAVRSTHMCAEQSSPISYVSITKHEVDKMCQESCRPAFLKPIIRHSLASSDITTWLSSRRSMYASFRLRIVQQHSFICAYMCLPR